MIVGIGVDIVEIEKLRRAMVRRGDRLRNRAFTAGEIAYCEERASRYQHYAGRFAAKEAVFKAIGTGWRGGIGWHDAEVKNEMSGKPVLILSGRALEIAHHMGVRQFWLSLSHTDRYAVAQVVLEG
ncbi:MAG: holo-ACP synthase [Acidobacteria bacterium]|nr:holo-ACP synthase [Acidobacteriota bacterium]MCI0724624.1 holo-ACP synthase [Acidobacteriota bacterium]